MSAALKCEQCAADLEEGTKFCAFCGAKTAAPAQIPEPEPETKPAPEPASDPVSNEQPAPSDFAADINATVAVSQPPPNNYAQASAPFQGRPGPDHSRASSGGADASAERKAQLKKYVLPAAAIVAALAVIFSVLPLVIGSLGSLGSSKYRELRGSLYITMFDDQVEIFNGRSKHVINGSLRESATSMDGRKAALLIYEDSEEGSTLYLFDGKSVKRISDGVYEFILAASGNGVAYTKNISYEHGTAELHLYSGGNASRLTTQLSAWGRNYCISPNGKTVGYAVRGSNDNIEGFYWDGKVRELGRNKSPMFISDGAKYIYFDRNGVFSVQRGMRDDTSERLEDISNIYSYHFNSDLSQVVLSTRDGRGHISSKGKPTERISANSVEGFLAPENTQAMYGYNNRAYYVIYGISSFSGTFFVNSSSSIVYLDRKFETNTVRTNIDQAYLASNGRTIIYLRSRSLYKISDATKQDAADNAVELGRNSDDVRRFWMLKNGGAVYYENTDNEVIYQKGTGRPERVSDGISSGILFQKTGGFYYIFDRELYVSSGRRGARARGLEGNVSSMFADKDFIWASSRDGGETLEYISTNGKKFELIGIR
jgi:hypothetical protein